MTASLHAPSPNQPQPKSALTASQVLTTEDGNTNVPAKSVNTSKPRPTRTRQDNVTIDPASKVATVALIRRTLAPEKGLAGQQSSTSQTDIGNVLPPLTSSNELDLQLYAILAIVIKEFVNTWYSKITPDHAFVDEVIQIIAHCSRALEQRLRRVDLTEILLNDVFVVLEEHVKAYRIAMSPLARTPYHTQASHIYHDLYPHPALSPVPDKSDGGTSSQQSNNEAAYRQVLAQGTLAVLLPTEDLQNTPLRILVGDILADLILGQALAGKICQGWFLHDAITKVITTITQKVQPKASGSEIRDDAKSRLEKYGLLSSETQRAYGDSSSKHQSSATAWFWRLLQYGYLAILFLRQLIVGLHQAKSLPKRRSASQTQPASPTGSKTAKLQGLAASEHAPRPVLEYRVFSFGSTLLNLDRQMPWMASVIVFWQHLLLDGALQIGAANSLLDRYLYQSIRTYILTPTIIPSVLVNLRLALFPNNSLGPPAPPFPDSEERIKIKRRAAESILSVLPVSVAQTYYGTDDREKVLARIETDMLDPFEDEYFNKHAIYRILDLLLVKLLPELEEQGIQELLADRGVIPGGTDDPEVVETKE